MSTEALIPFAAYILLCIISVLFGRTVLWLGRVGMPLAEEYLMAPLVSTAIWSLVLACIHTMGLRVRVASVILWWVILVISTLGIARRAHGTPVPWWTLVPCLLLPIMTLAAAFFHGLSDYQISVAPDGWAYVAAGQYAWEFPVRGAAGGNEPLYQYAKTLLEGRLAASSFLGLFSRVLAPGDAQATSGLVQAYGLFVLATACAAFFSRISRGSHWAILYSVLIVFSGWTMNIMLVSNWDHLLALPYLPGCLTLAATTEPRRNCAAVLLGVLVAALVVTYPEGALFAIGAAVVLIVERWAREHEDWKSALAFMGLSAGMACLLLAPNAKRLAAFFARQMAAAMLSGSRPGEGLFWGLTFPRTFLAAFWGLGPEWSGGGPGRRHWIMTAAALVLSALALGGFVRMAVSWVRPIATIAGFLLLAAAYMMGVQSYGYGAYKIITFARLLIIVGVVFGLAAVAGVRRWHARWWLGAISVVACALTLPPLRTFSLFPSIPPTAYARISMKEFRSLQRIHQVTGGRPILVAVDDWLANEWAVYYLRQAPVYLATYRMYMAAANALPLMQRASTPPLDQVAFVLTDDQAPLTRFAPISAWELVWATGPYRLWSPRQAEWAVVAEVIDVGRLQMANGKATLWPREKAIAFAVIANHIGQVYISGRIVPDGSPSLNPPNSIRIETSRGYTADFASNGGAFSFDIPVVAGKNVIRIVPTDGPRARGSNGDPRPRALGVEDLQVVWQHAADPARPVSDN